MSYEKQFKLKSGKKRTPMHADLRAATERRFRSTEATAWAIPLTAAVLTRAEGECLLSARQAVAAEEEPLLPSSPPSPRATLAAPAGPPEAGDVPETWPQLSSHPLRGTTPRSRNQSPLSPTCSPSRKT